jgi:hypothetical protein
MRTVITTDYTARIYPWYNVMAVIQTWLWDDIQVWEDDKYWWDAWILWTWYTARTIITTNYT